MTASTTTGGWQNYHLTGDLSNLQKWLAFVINFPLLHENSGCLDTRQPRLLYYVLCHPVLGVQFDIHNILGT
jgi:hypothetical protein